MRTHEMAGDPLAVATFTALPLLALFIGILVSIWAAVRVDRRLLLATVLLSLMGSHQLTEVWLLLAGQNPISNLPGEVVETSVNLLTVAVVWVLIRRIETERRRGERQALVQREVLDSAIPGKKRPESPVTEPLGVFSPASFELPVVGHVLAWAYTTLPLGNTAMLSTVLETAVRNLQVTFPAANFQIRDEPEVTVFAEATTLREIVETVLKQLIVYNDSSEPAVELTVETRGSTVLLRLSDNGPGLPPEVAAQLAGELSTGRPNLELEPVSALLEKWGGSIGVEDGAILLGLVSPNPIRENPRN